MGAIFGQLISYLTRGVIVKFFTVGVIYYALSLLWPLMVSLVARFVDVGSLNSSLSSIPSGVWWVLGFFRIEVGLKLCISAWATRFLIRRLPVIG